MKTILAVATWLGGLIGGLTLCIALLSAGSALQQAAGAAVAIAAVVIPYCLFRVTSECASSRDLAETRRLLELMVAASVKEKQKERV